MYQLDKVFVILTAWIFAIWLIVRRKVLFFWNGVWNSVTVLPNSG